MSEVKHTPGPWKACHDGDCKCGQIHSVPVDAGVAVLEGENEEGFPVVTDQEERRYNAKLIASAPELLAALMKAVNDYGKEGGPWNVPNEPGTWIEMSKAAISKATT